MEFNKTEIIRNLNALEAEIRKVMPQAASGVPEYEDLMFVSGLIDDIECGRITEFPMVEKTNFMSGESYLEDPDTPRACSPSTELFWSM